MFKSLLSKVIYKTSYFFMNITVLKTMRAISFCNKLEKLHPEFYYFSQFNY